MRVRTGFAGVMCMAMASAAFAGANVGDTAPEVGAKNWFNLPSGVKSLQPEHLKGKLVMVEFWATW